MGIRYASKQINDEPLNEQSIQRRLNSFFASHKYMVDNLYVFEWESDKLIWTKAGYIYEFEIKISRADFRNDFKHKKEKHIILQGPTDKEQMMPDFYRSYEWNKTLYSSIEELRAKLKPTDSCYIANHRKPNYFYYVVPDGLIRPEEVPEYAGLLYVQKEKPGFVLAKKAPQLHKVKYKDAELNLGEKFYYNWQNDRRLRLKAQRDADSVNKLLRDELSSKNQEMTYAQMEQLVKIYKDDRDNYFNKYTEMCRDRNIDRMVIRRMAHRLKELDPEFNYLSLEEECEKVLYGNKQT